MALQWKKSFWAKGGRFTRRDERKGSSGEESEHLSSLLRYPDHTFRCTETWKERPFFSFTFLYLPSSSPLSLEQDSQWPSTEREKGSHKEMDQDEEATEGLALPEATGLPDGWNSFSGTLQPTVQKDSLERSKKVQKPQASSKQQKHMIVMSQLVTEDLESC